MSVVVLVSEAILQLVTENGENARFVVRIGGNGGPEGLAGRVDEARFGDVVGGKEAVLGDDLQADRSDEGTVLEGRKGSHGKTAVLRSCRQRCQPCPLLWEDERFTTCAIL